MADTLLPDKWVRKAIKDAFHNSVVSGNIIPVFDMRAEGYSNPHYVLLSTQSNVPQESKCGDGWIHNIEIQILTSFRINKGSRLLADLIMERLLDEIEDLTLDPASSMVINSINRTFPGDINDIDDSKVFYRKILRLELYIN